MRDALSRFVMRSNLEMKIDTWTLHTLDPDIPSAAVTVSRIGAFEGGHVMLQPGAGRVQLGRAGLQPFGGGDGRRVGLRHAVDVLGDLGRAARRLIEVARDV